MEVHRYLCRVVNGVPPDNDSYALHNCGNGHLGCVNPKHIYWGTQKQNFADSIRHGAIRKDTRTGQFRGGH